MEALLYCAIRLVYICFGIGEVPDLPTLFEVFLLFPLLIYFLGTLVVIFECYLGSQLTCLSINSLGVMYFEHYTLFISSMKNLIFF